MKNTIFRAFTAGLIFTVLISNTIGFVRDGLELERLRSSVLRLHILAASDSPRDQQLKLMVRDRLLTSGIFDDADSLEAAEKTARENLPKIKYIAERTLREGGCTLPVTAELADTEFDERTYGDITMPAGTYRALRIKIGEAHGHNWWCVMYPPLCLPAAVPASSDAVGETVEENRSAEELFDEEELDILNHPKKYAVRFAIWDKIKSLCRS